MTPAVVAARTLLQDDLIVVASLPLEAVLARWQEDRSNIMLVGSLLSLVVLGTAGVTHWYVRRMDRARLDVEEGKAWLDQALASMSDGLLLCDSAGRLVAWNDRYVEIFPWVRGIMRPGLKYEELLRASVDRLIPEDEQDRREAIFRHRLEEHQRGVTSSEYQLTPELRLHVTERRTQSGGVVSVFRDVTSGERELRRARRAERAAEEARTEFVEAVARRVSQPANNVVGMTELLETAELPEMSKRYVKWARESASEIISSVDDLLNASRPAVSRRNCSAKSLVWLRLSIKHSSGHRVGRLRIARTDCASMCRSLFRRCCGETHNASRRRSSNRRWPSWRPFLTKMSRSSCATRTCRGREFCWQFGSCATN